MRRHLRRCIRSRRLRRARARGARTRGRRATPRRRRARRVRQRLIRCCRLLRLGLQRLLRVRRLQARRRSFRFLATRIRRRFRVGIPVSQVGLRILRSRVRQRQRMGTRLIPVDSLRMRVGFMMRAARGVPVPAPAALVPAPVPVGRGMTIIARRIPIRLMTRLRRSGDARSCRRWRGRLRMSARRTTSRWRSFI